MAAEMYGYLASTLPSLLTYYGEDGTTDLTVYRTQDIAGICSVVWENGRAASIDLKLVFAATRSAPCG